MEGIVCENQRNLRETQVLISRWRGFAIRDKFYNVVISNQWSVFSVQKNQLKFNLC